MPVQAPPILHYLSVKLTSCRCWRCHQGKSRDVSSGTRGQHVNRGWSPSTRRTATSWRRSLEKEQPRRSLEHSGPRANSHRIRAGIRALRLEWQQRAGGTGASQKRRGVFFRARCFPKRSGEPSRCNGLDPGAKAWDRKERLLHHTNTRLCAYRSSLRPRCPSWRHTCPASQTNSCSPWTNPQRSWASCCKQIQTGNE